MNNKIWDYFKRMMCSPYGKTFKIFLLSQGLFLTLILIFQLFTDKKMEYVKVTQGWMVERGMHTVQMAYFLVFVYIFVSLNTNVFIKDLTDILADTNPLPGSKNDNVKNLKDKALFWLDKSKYITGMIVLAVPTLLIFFYNDKYWSWMLQINELLSVLLFFIFVYVDFICLRISDLFLTEPNLSPEDKIKFNLFKTSIKQYLMASDAPGCFGLLVIFVFSLVLHPLVNLLYWQGFVVGAMGLHMALSQSSLAFLGLIEYKCDQNVCLK